METLYRKVLVSDDKKIIGRASNVISHLNDLIHKLAYGGNDDLQEIAFKNAKDFFDILSKDFQSEIPDPTAQLTADKEDLLEALEKVKRLEPIICMGGAVAEQWQNEAQALNEMMAEVESLIQKHKP